MKKLFLFFVCASSFAFANAQTKFGIKAGANIASLSGDDVEDAKAKVSLNAGVFAELPLASSISLRPELVFSGQGAKASESGFDYKLNLNYINLPILAKWTAGSGGFFAETGPQFGFLMSAKAKGDGGDVDVKDEMKGVDFSWAFGLGYHVAPNIGINARYNLGLSNVYDADDVKVKNSVFQVGLFYSFGAAATASK
jgi:hypothetical protein